jgi:Fe-S cluster assembly protein SufD
MQAMAQVKVQIDCAENSSFEMIESFVCLHEGAAFTQRSLDVHVSKNASVTVNKIQMETDGCFLMNQDRASVDADARFTIQTLTVDGGWVRNDLHISLDGTNIEAHLNGFYLPRRRQLVDNHTKVDHRFAHCNSNELYKGILRDQSTGVFNGKVYVHLDAQKTNAYQSNANVLLSDDAQMNTKPELEIYADDVKCSHGTTTGQLDPNALFYLKSRGLSDDNARKLLTTAFIHDVLEQVQNEAVRSYVVAELLKRELLFV